MGEGGVHQGGGGRNPPFRMIFTKNPPFWSFLAKVPHPAILILK